MSLASWMNALDAPHRSDRVYTVAGAKMRCIAMGSGPSLLLLHGLLGTADAWCPTAAHLAAESTVYAPDALGIGQSDRVLGLDAGLEATAARTVELMDAAGIDRADVVGTSHGGAVAMMFAARHPERVRSLILHAPANPFSAIADPLIQFYRTALGQWFAYRVATLPAGVQALALGRMYGDASRVRSGSLDPYISSLRVPGTVAHVLRILEGWERDMRLLEQALPSLRSVPVQLIWGTRDRAVSLASGERLAALLGADLIVMPGAGHLPHEEMPATLAKVIRTFLTGQSRQGAVAAARNGFRRDAA